MPNERQEAILELVGEWMRRAQADLTVACLTEEERIAPEILAFHAQQAVEKALKALLVLRQVEFPHIHAIAPLLNLCREAGFEGTEAFTNAALLTRYAVATRYPGFDELVTLEEASIAAATASRIVSWAETQIQQNA